MKSTVGAALGAAVATVALSADVLAQEVANAQQQDVPAECRIVYSHMQGARFDPRITVDTNFVTQQLGPNMAGVGSSLVVYITEDAGETYTADREGRAGPPKAREMHDVARDVRDLVHKPIGLAMVVYPVRDPNTEDGWALDPKTGESTNDSFMIYDAEFKAPVMHTNEGVMIRTSKQLRDELIINLSFPQDQANLATNTCNTQFVGGSGDGDNSRSVASTDTSSGDSGSGSSEHKPTL